MKLIFYSGDMPVKVEADVLCTRIEDSHRIKRSREMKAFLREVKKAMPSTFAVNRISEKAQIREWRAHNLLYALGIEKERTGSVDLDYEKPSRRICYFILSCLYPHS